MKSNLLILITTLLFWSCHTKSKTQAKKNDALKNSEVVEDPVPFPKELVHFQTFSENPVFEGTGEPTWDQKIRERGYILKEGDTYHMWYTGLRPDGESLPWAMRLPRTVFHGNVMSTTQYLMKVGRKT